MSAEGIESIAELSRWMTDLHEQWLEAQKKFIGLTRTAHEGLKGFLAKNMTGFVVGWDRVTDGERRYIAAHKLGGAPRVTHTGTIETAQFWMTEAGVAEWQQDIRRSWGEDAKGNRWPAPVEELAEAGCEELIVFRVRVVVTPHSKTRIAKAVAH